MRIAGLLLAAVTVMGQAPAAQAPPTPPAPRPIGTMSELMVNIVYPSSDAIFYISTRTPETPGEWLELQTNAMMLGEAANLLMMPGRARDDKKWMEDAKLLHDVGLAAFRAAKAKNVEALTALNEQLEVSCVQCHQDYRPNYRRRAPPRPEPAP
jgi:hypothetical protein